MKRLNAKGWEVVGLDDFSAPSLSRDEAKHILDVSVNDTRTIAKLMDSVDVVYHLACATQAKSFSSPIHDVETNVVGTVSVLSAIKKSARQPHLVFTSSCSVYGLGPFVLGQHQLNPVTPYGVSKLAAERYIGVMGVPATILRLSNVYGPGQTPTNPHCGVVGRMVYDALRHNPLRVIGSGAAVRDFTYVGDVTDKMVWLAEKRANATFNISTGVGTTIDRLAAMVWDEVRKQTGYAPVTTFGNTQRDIDSVDVRVVEPTVLCGTTLEEGLKLTVEEAHASLEG